jgi:hypothetical protein
MHCLRGNSIKIVDNEKGIALITALVLSFLGMLMIASLLTMVNTGTWLSGSKKRYHLALDAAHGGLEFITKEIIPTELGGANLTSNDTYDRVFKLVNTSGWHTKLTTTGIFDYPNAPDATVTFTPEMGPAITVSTTIRSTSRGNSAITNSPLLIGGGVIDNNNGGGGGIHIPYLYQNVTQGQNTTNPIENARLTSIYVY